MNSTKHTPGPWHACERSAHEIVIVGPNGLDDCSTLADVFMLDPDEPGDSLANAHLIAAAPEMLAALEDAVALLTPGETDCGYPEAEAREVLRAAIAKATGED